MKSPTQLTSELERQWHKASWRARRLLPGSDAWPITMHIGLPDSATFSGCSSALQEHLALWRAIDQNGPGRVLWQSKKYRAGAAEVRLPTQWQLDKPSEWVAAIGSSAVKQAFGQLQKVLAQVDDCLRRVLLHRMTLWQALPADQVILAAQVAMQLEPGCAQGRPLRMLPIAGNDTKFFERHESLITLLLDARFDGEASAQGLRTFIGAMDEREHWLLIAPLADGLLPFKRLRLTAESLLSAALPASHILVIENERCLHQLPYPVPDTIAILGAGMDLGWMAADWLKSRHVGYWGDMDTWGLTMLGHARSHAPHLTALLMDADTFHAHQAHAVFESHHAPDTSAGLLEAEVALLKRLKTSDKGRLEQEFLPADCVAKAIAMWLKKQP
ncbi:hypothetical protein E9531_00850 [Lampropedia puyangensis]|uniref:DUF3322 and DUF2220 domain-containing protein n=1 Tax=Lampropedia puyangensis TaxID=1330072 RepID=A0A4S8FEP8_9BURK|nr:Wadjet anti-phage system protein JetD domain-containing protein [Lampropedia puyangensis]THU05134.1 hypothetical protein E9531_00850 [Lampropedia puyangensis]